MEKKPEADQKQTKEEVIEFTGSIFKKYGINHPVLEFRTPFERSPYSCIENIIRSTLKSFGIVYGAKAVLALIGLLLKFNKTMKNPKLILKALFDVGYFKIASFTASIAFLIKSIITVMRIVRKKDDGWNGFAGGIVAGYFSMFLLKSKKVFLATFMLARASECIYNSIADKGYYKRNDLHWVAIYLVAMTTLGYTYAYERYLTDPGAIKSFDFGTNMNKTEWIMIWIYHELTRRRLAQSGIHADPHLIMDTKA
jgi:hypothetical protein